MRSKQIGWFAQGPMVYLVVHHQAGLDLQEEVKGKVKQVGTFI